MKIAKWSPFRLFTLQELDVSQLRRECFAVLACQRFVRFQMFVSMRCTNRCPARGKGRCVILFSCSFSIVYNTPNLLDLLTLERTKDGLRRIPILLHCNLSCKGSPTFPPFEAKKSFLLTFCQCYFHARHGVGGCSYL